MELVGIVGLLALIEYWVFLMLTGQARGRFGVAAPATAGHPIFERYFRVQMNTLEQLAIFLPALGVFAWSVSEAWAVLLGVVFIVGRALYARGYIQDPAKRGPGFLLTLIANGALVLGSLVALALRLPGVLMHG
ncbi:MAG TPA: MAPEG family protein [Burkholderiales bacterium]|nr:MAPEG family protein [Burkholderiales bacterium]